jgi:hypothetical protein
MKKQVLKNSLVRKISIVTLIILIAITLIYSSIRSEKKNNLIPEKDLVTILSELYVADGLLAYPPIHSLFSAKDSISNYLDIIQRYGYTKERMDKTMRYYFDKKPKKLENIYDQVLTKLSEKQALLEKEIPLAPKVLSNLWAGPAYFAVPESGIKDQAWFNIPIKDTGNYVLTFTTILFTDDQSLNPKVTVFFWHTDSSKTEFRTNWPVQNLPKDGLRHNYTLSQINTNSKITHVSGWLLDNDQKTGSWVKHAKVENIILRKTIIQ